MSYRTTKRDNEEELLQTESWIQKWDKVNDFPPFCRSCSHDDVNKNERVADTTLKEQTAVH